MDQNLNFPESFASALALMAVEYEADALAQGKTHMGGAFLNGFQSAVSHLLDVVRENPAALDRLPACLDEMMSAFDILAKRCGVEQTTIEV